MNEFLKSVASNVVSTVLATSFFGWLVATVSSPLGLVYSIGLGVTAGLFILQFLWRKHVELHLTRKCKTSFMGAALESPGMSVGTYLITAYGVKWVANRYAQYSDPFDYSGSTYEVTEVEFTPRCPKCDLSLSEELGVWRKRFYWICHGPGCRFSIASKTSRQDAFYAMEQKFKAEFDNKRTANDA